MRQTVRLTRLLVITSWLPVVGLVACWAGWSVFSHEPAPPYVGSSLGRVYHKANGCYYVREQLRHHVTFKTAEDAERDGRQPCHECFPQGRQVAARGQ